MTRDKVEKALDKIRPRLMLDGVYIRLVDAEQGVPGAPLPSGY